MNGWDDITTEKIGYVLSGLKNAQGEGVIYGNQTEQSIVSFARIPRPIRQGWVEIQQNKRYGYFTALMDFAGSFCSYSARGIKTLTFTGPSKWGARSFS